MAVLVSRRDPIFFRLFTLIGSEPALLPEAINPFFEARAVGCLDFSLTPLVQCLTSWGLPEIRMNPLLSMTKQSRSWGDTPKGDEVRPYPEPQVPACPGSEKAAPVTREKVPLWSGAAGKKCT